MNQTERNPNMPNGQILDKKSIIKKTENFVREKLEGEHTGHDWWHVHRVRTMAVRIAAEENANRFIVELAALLHDIADWKFHDGDDSVGPRIARQWLERLRVAHNDIDHIGEIIATMSFKGAGVTTKMNTKEGMIVQDADRLDAIGAIGIARCFAYGGASKSHVIHDPNLTPRLHQSFEEYKKSNSSSINHFYEKLLLVKDRMNTDAAQRIAKKRHGVMEQFLEQFFQEWAGKDESTYVRTKPSSLPKQSIKLNLTKRGNK